MDTAQIIQVLAGTAAAFGGFFVGKGLEKAKTKKVEAETDSINISSTERAINIWENLNKQLHDELQSLRNQVMEIKRENGILHKENVELKKQVGILSEEVKRLTQLSQ